MLLMVLRQCRKLCLGCGFDCRQAEATVEPDRREQDGPLWILLSPFDAASFHLNFPRVLQTFVPQASEEPVCEKAQRRFSVVGLC